MREGIRMEILTLKQVEKMDFCTDCKKFVKRFKGWNEKKVPAATILTNYECKECKLSFDVYKGMCQVWHHLGKKENKH